MTTTTAIYQCETCQRQFDAEGQLLAPRLCVPESFVCAREDCVAPVQEIENCQLPIENLPSSSGPKQPRPARRASRSSCHDSDAVYRGCPPERDFEFSQNAETNFANDYGANEKNAQLDHGGELCKRDGESPSDSRERPATSFSPIETPRHAQQQAEFAHSAANRDRQVFELLAASFDFSRPEIPGAWVSGLEILEKLGVKAANSCAARLREWEEMASLDVDSSMIENPHENGKQYWAYRICRKEESLRLQREEKRKAEKAHAGTSNNEH